MLRVIESSASDALLMGMAMSSRSKRGIQESTLECVCGWGGGWEERERESERYQREKKWESQHVMGKGQRRMCDRGKKIECERKKNSQNTKRERERGKRVGLCQQPSPCMSAHLDRTHTYWDTLSRDLPLWLKRAVLLVAPSTDDFIRGRSARPHVSETQKCRLLLRYLNKNDLHVCR